MQDTYKIILDSYAKRLITTNSRTRTIYYSKNNKYIMDISRFMKGFNSSELFDFFCTEKGLKELKLSYGAMSTSKTFDLFDQYLNKEITEEEFLKYYSVITDDDLALLSKEKKSCYIELYNKYEKLKKKELQQILKIKEENDSIIKQMGKNDLYIGYPYIQGRFNKDKVVRAPLLLHKVSVKEVGENLMIKNEGIKILNPVFIMSYLVENELTYTDSLDFEIMEDDYMPVVDKIFNNIGIKCVNKMDDDLVKMKNLTKEEFKKNYKYTDNNFEIFNGVTLGVFPLSDKKIYDDVKDLKDSDNVNAMLNSFYDKSSEVKVFENEDLDVDESKLKYITVLDYSQKKTLQEALNKNCIIQGPPGTGKSQVIANIAANLLLNRKNVLFCSEKRTATDVIYNRLGKLNAFALLLHDHIGEKNSFYDSIIKAVKTAKENIDKYKNKSFSFNQDYKINAFFNNAKQYSSIVNGDYKGLSLKEILDNNDKELILEEEFKKLSSMVDNKDRLEEFLYKYDASNSYQIALKWKKELIRDYYFKYDFSILNGKLFKLKDIVNEVNNCTSNYIKNNLVNSFINNAEMKNNFFKSVFCKKEKLSESCLEFLDGSKHNFAIFNEYPYANDLEKLLFILKFGNGLTNDQIINNYMVCISKELYKQIDFDFASNYTSTYEMVMKDIFESMDSKMEDSIEFIARNCSADIKEKLSNPKYNDMLQKLLGEVNKKRKPPIKVIIDKYFEIIQIIFPIWIMTPDVVSAVIPLKEGIFDKVIFDEASQLFIEKAIPAISRSNSVVICGDSKQLRPTLFFESRYDETEEDVNIDIDQESALTENSLLDYATTSNKYMSTMLRYHYRCYYKELINFSNYAFYNGDLVFASNAKGDEKKPLETINVNGKWDGEKNIIEANKTVELIKELLINRKNNETIGVITLNVNQRDLILDCLDEECKKDDRFASLYHNERVRKDEKTGEDESLFVKNLESVQGDERDIIIFSISYSKNGKGKIGSSLGEIQRQYGENRLNVAISRAKKKIYIIKSFMGEDLTINDNNKGPLYFKKYLCYADALNSDKTDLSKNLLLSLSEVDNKVMDVENNGWFEDDVYHCLINSIDLSLFDVKRNIEVGSFVIKLAVFDKKNNKYLLGIDCVESRNNINENQTSDDVYKQYYLENRGWDIYKVWITDWYINKDAEIRGIIETVSKY